MVVVHRGKETDMSASHHSIGRVTPFTRRASVEGLESRRLLSAGLRPRPGAVDAAPLAAAPSLGPTQLLAGDTSPAAAAGPQLAPKIARGGNEYLAVWADRRTAVGANGSIGIVYFGAGIGSMTDILAARLDASGNVIDTTPIVISQADFNQTAPQVEWNGQNWLVTWMTERNNDRYYSDVNAVRVSPAGQVLDNTPIVISAADTTLNQFPPYSVASDGTNWTVLFRGLDSTAGIWTLQATRIAPDGTLMDPAPHTVRQPAANVLNYSADLVFAGDEYLMVWSEAGSDFVSGTIRGQVLSTTLSPIGSSFLINRYTPTDADRPSIATDGSGFLVTWSEERYYGFSQLFASRVSHGGTVLDVAGIAITPQVSGDYTMFSPDVTFDGTNYIVAFNDQISGASFEQDLYAQRISTAGALVGAATHVQSAAGDQQEASIAPKAGGGAQVIWTDRSLNTGDGDIFGTQVSAAGVAGTLAAISLGAPRQTVPQLAGNGNGYLAVFKSETSGTARILAQHLNSAGVPIDAQPTVIASGANTIQQVAVAWNGSEYLVTWNDGRQVFARRVNADGVAIEPSPFFVMAGTAPSVSALGTTFLVADVNWPITPEQQYTFVTRVSAAGAVLGSPIQLGTGFDTHPRLAAVGGNWLVAWQNAPTHDSPIRRVFARFVDPAGSPSATFTVASNGGLPDLASDGNSALVVFNAGGAAGDVFGRRVQADGSQSAIFTISNAPNVQQSAAVAWDGHQFLVDWTDLRNYAYPQQDRTDIYAARVATDNTVLDTDGFAVASTIQPDEMPAVAAHGGSAVFAWSTYRPEPPFGAMRIATRQLTSAFARLQGRTLIVDGTEGNDVISIGSTDGGTTATITLNASSLSFSETDFDAVQVNALGGDDTLNFDGGVAQPISFSGGAGASSLHVNAGTFVFNEDAAATTPGLGVLVNSGATASFNATQHLGSLDVRAGGAARLTFGSGKVLVTNALALSDIGVLDLNDNDLIVNYTGKSPLNMIQGLINQARNGGAWNGLGLTSLFAAANQAHTTTLGAMEASDFVSMYGTSARFDGEPLSGSAVLVKYTYYGDTDFNGKVNFDDYVRTDSGFNNHLIGWSNGDFDGNGIVNFDDYVLIDLAFNAGGPAL
jgi:hypothetical protein